MARPSELDPRIVEAQLDIEAEIRARDALAKAGINKPEDLQAGRADLARVSEILTNANVDDEVNPFVAEKIARDKEFAELVAEQTQAEPEPQYEEGREPDRLSVLQQELDSQRAETAKWKLLLGRSEDRRGKEERKHKELMARMAPVQPFVDARSLTGKNADDVLTAQEVSNLLMNLTAAFGNQIREAKEEAIREARTPEEARIPIEIETELAEKFPWLADLSQTQKERAIMDILSAQPGVAAPRASTPAVPQQRSNLPTTQEQARARVREVGYIEASNRGSSAEQRAIAPAQQAAQKKLAELREALNKPNGSTRAEEILQSLGAGLTDDSQASYLLRRNRR